MSRYSSPGYSAAELTAAVRERGREAVSWLMAGEDAGPPPGLVVDPMGNYSASPAALAAARARRTGDGTGELRPPSSAAKEELTSRGVKQQQRLKSAVTKVAAASAFANSRDDARTNSRSTPTRKGTGSSNATPTHARTPARTPTPEAPPHTTDRHRAGRSPRRNPRASAPRHRQSGLNREGAQSRTTLLRPRFEPRRPHPGRGIKHPSRLGRASPSLVNTRLIDEIERSREEDAERARKGRIREITRAAEEATAVATAAAAVAGAASVASAVRAQLAQRRDLPAAPSQTPMYQDPPPPPTRTTAVNTEVVTRHLSREYHSLPPGMTRDDPPVSFDPDPDPKPSPPSFNFPHGFVPDRRDAEALVMATAVKLEKERRSLRDELEICQKRQWDLDSRELGLKQREHACAKAVELYHMREDGRGEHISASNRALLRESEDARRDLDGIKKAAIEAEERAKRAEARLRMIEEDADGKRDELEALRSKARARAAHDAKKFDTEPEWERSYLVS